MNIKAIVVTAAFFIAGTVQAAVVANSLPYTGTPDWSDVTFDGTSMISNGSSSTLVTAPGRGVWFGWLASQNPPAGWSLGSSSEGNYLSFTASFTSGSTDWSAYFYDKLSLADIEFADTGCDGNATSCYGLTGYNGVKVIHAGATALDYAETLVSLDLSILHHYEVLLKDGFISYRIDGSVVYSGLAYQAPSSSSLLVIGDGSGSTQTGQGSMTITSVSFDNAPIENVLVSAVPVPAAAWLFGSALIGLVGLKRKQ